MFCMVSAVMLVFATLAPLRAATEQNTGEKEIYIVAIDSEYAPYEFADVAGRTQGFTPDLLKKIGERVGVSFQFQAMPWPDAVAGLEDGTIDVVSMIKTAKRVGKYDFSETHSTIKQAIFRHKSAGNIRGLESLSGFRIALQKNDVSYEKLRERIDFKIHLVRSKEDGFLHLNSGKVDAFFTSEKAGLRFIREYDLDKIEVAALGLFPQDFCFTMRKGNKEVIALLNMGMQELKKSGQYDQLLTQWFVKFPLTPDENVFPWKRFFAAIAALIAIILFSTFWIFVLRRRVKVKTAALQQAHNKLDLKVRERTAELQEEIMQRKRVEKDLRESEKKYSFLYEEAPLPYQSLDYNGCFLEVNNAWLRLLGFKKEEVIGKSFGEFFLPERKEHFAFDFPHFMHKEEILGVEFEMVKKDGSVILVHFNGKIAHDKDGNFQQTHCIFQDITEHRAFEEQIRKSKEEWEKTFDAMGDIVTIQDKNMHIVRANKAAYQFFKEAKYGELNGKYCYELFTGRSEACSGCPILNTLKSVETHSAIMTHENLGKTFRVSTSAITTEEGEFEYLVHVAKDITEQIRLEEELLQAHKMEAMGTLAGGIAHDFNNILSAIIGYSELALLDSPAGSNAARDMEQVIQAGNRAADLVQQILTFSRKSDHCLEPINPHLIIKEALKMLRSSLPSTIQIVMDIDKKCGKIMADPINIHQIVVNLCTNSLYAMENEKGVLHVSLQRKEVSDKEVIGESDVSSGPFIVLEIRDTGHGMDQVTAARIFEPYFTTKGIGKGTGLGLAVIHGIIQDYHGFIQVKSVPEEGATFSVYIPALQEEKPASNEIETTKDSPAGTERILIVDDESMIVNMNKTVLERLGYTVSTTTDSLDALEKVRTNPDQFDLIITDQTMPNLTGAELAQKILKIKHNIPIILCTGYSSILSEGDALAIGIKKYTRKPVDRTTLAQVVRKVLDEK